LKSLVSLLRGVVVAAAAPWREEAWVWTFAVAKE
jgi:hypothetical protein